jgi:hypothetical protein
MKIETMPTKSLIKEHKDLVKVLKGGKKSELKKEAKEQGSELKGYRKDLNTPKKGRHCTSDGYMQ